MGVFFILGKRTGQSLGIRRFLHRLKARIRVLMLQNLDFAADQIAVIIIAASGVLMGLDLRQRAPKVPIFVIACRIMLVNDKVCIPTRQVSFTVIAGIVMLMEIQAFDGTHRLGSGGRGYLRVASLRMGVFRNLTRSLFHGNGGKNQCVDRAEHHNAGKTGYNPVPAFLPLMCLRIFFCAL